MTVRAPFQPKRGANQVVTPGAVSASATIDAESKSVRLVNSGATNLCYVRIGYSPQTASTADLVVLPNSSIIVSKEEGEDTVAYIQSVGGTTLQIQPGEGGV